MRKVRTASGATAVQIASKTRGVRTIVEHLGSAHEDEQLVVLIAIARERIAELAGQVPFDLDGLGATPLATTAPTVTGSRSRLLWEVLEDAYTRLGFDTVGNDMFKKLVLARVVEPTSKADMLRVWDELGVPRCAVAVDGVTHPRPVRGAGLAVEDRHRRIRACDRDRPAHRRALRRPPPCTSRQSVKTSSARWG